MLYVNLNHCQNCTVKTDRTTGSSETPQNYSHFISLILRTRCNVL